MLSPWRTDQRTARFLSGGMTLHRGVGLRRDDLHPELAERIDHVLGGGSDPHLSRDLLNHIHRDGEGMGSCWSPQDWMADWYNKQVSADPPGTMFPRMEPADYSVTISGDWDGSRGQQGYDEDIYNLEPGAEVKVHGLKVKSRGTDGKDWVDLGGDNTVVRHATAPVLDKPADFPDDWFEKHWGDDDDAPLPVPEQTGPPPRPADKILNEWVEARDSITPENLSDWHAAPWTNPLEQTLYKEFQHDWWPNSEASKVRTPENVNTGWSFHPDEPITHWLNVEDFLNERYPEAATGGKYGLEHAAPMLQRKVDDQMLSPEKMKEYGYIGHGNAITQAMLNLHNKLQGRKWDRPQDQKRYYELMLRHIGPNGKKVSRLAKLIEAMAWQDWAPKIEPMTAVHAGDRYDYVPAAEQSCKDCEDDGLNPGRYYWNDGNSKWDYNGGKLMRYVIKHHSTIDPGRSSYLAFGHHRDDDGPYVAVHMIETDPMYRRDGVAESLMRRLHDDHPGIRINPGGMSPDGKGFYDRMLEKEPDARNIVAQANRLLLAMAWEDWAPKIKGGCPDGGCTRNDLPELSERLDHVLYDRAGIEGRYTIPQAGAFLDYYHYNHRGQDQVAVSGIYTHPSNRGDGVAEALMRRLSEDHPGVPINPGVMTRDGQEFHDRMLEKEPSARELVTAAHQVLRHAIDMTSPEGRAQIEQLMQMQEQFKKWREGPHDNWYHVSPHDLPEGTKLVPGGVGNSATSQDFYDMGFGDDSGNLKDMGAGRTQHVWLTPDLDDAHFWSAALNAPHIYEVDPHETPSPWNGTGTDGFVSPGATIRKKVSGGH
jgi:GNAT superfamily N-acetyltransferase